MCVYIYIYTSIYIYIHIYIYICAANNVCEHISLLTEYLNRQVSETGEKFVNLEQKNVVAQTIHEIVYTKAKTLTGRHTN